MNLQLTDDDVGEQLKLVGIGAIKVLLVVDHDAVDRFLAPIARQVAPMEELAPWRLQSTQVAGKRAFACSLVKRSEHGSQVMTVCISLP